MKQFYPIFFLIFFCFYSCSEKIEIKVPDAEPQIVVFGILNPDSLIEIRLSETRPMLMEGAYTFVDNADIELRADGHFMEHLQYTDSGWYRSSIIADAGVSYEIFVDVPNFELIYASTIVPTPIYISEGQVIPNAYYNYQMANYDSQADISFFDPPSEENYYQVSFYSYHFAGYGVDTVTNTIIVTDSTRLYTELYYMHSNDPVLENEGDMQYYQDIGNIKSLVFSDQLLTGYSNVSFLVKISPVYNEMPGVIFRNVNRDYYNFYKSFVRQMFNSDIGRFNAGNMFLVNNPNDLYTNIENGLGIFTAYAETHFELELTD